MGTVLAPVCWMVGLALRALHAVAGRLVDPDGGAAWLLATLALLALLRLALLPLAIRQARSRGRLAALAPALAAAGREHSGDPEKVAAARVAIYRDAGVNPAAGLVSLLLVQLPAFMGLVFVLHQVVILDRPGFGLSRALVESLRHATLAGAPLASSLRSSAAEVVALGGTPAATPRVALVLMVAAVAVTALSAYLSLRQLRRQAGPVWLRGSLVVLSVVAMAAAAAAVPVILSAYLTASTLWALLQGRWLRRRYRPRPD